MISVHRTGRLHRPGAGAGERVLRGMDSGGGMTALPNPAYHHYGSSNHRARLNFVDAFAYVLAKETGEAFFCEGNDFSQTDIQPALAG